MVSKETFIYPCCLRLFYLPLVDTPDPYIQLEVPGNPAGIVRTATRWNITNPTWNETFRFVLPQNEKSLLSKYLDTIGNIQNSSWKSCVKLSLFHRIYSKIYDVPMKFARKLIHGGPVQVVTMNLWRSYSRYHAETDMCWSTETKKK